MFSILYLVYDMIAYDIRKRDDEFITTRVVLLELSLL
jgi:hypothetical protein